MKNIIATIEFTRPCLYYTLSERVCSTGKVYDIECRAGDKSEIYDGVSDNLDAASEIFKKIAEAQVYPQHLLCIIDEMIV